MQTVQESAASAAQETRRHSAQTAVVVTLKDPTVVRAQRRSRSCGVVPAQVSVKLSGLRHAFLRSSESGAHPSSKGKVGVIVTSGDHSQAVIPCMAKCASKNRRAIDGGECFEEKRLQHCGSPASWLLMRPIAMQSIRPSASLATPALVGTVSGSLSY